MNLAYYPELVIVLLFLVVEASWFVICIVIKIIDMTLCSMSAKLPNENIGKLFNLGTFVIIFVFLCLIVNSLLLRVK